MPRNYISEIISRIRGRSEISSEAFGIASNVIDITPLMNSLERDYQSQLQSLSYQQVISEIGEISPRHRGSLITYRNEDRAGLRSISDSMERQLNEQIYRKNDTIENLQAELKAKNEEIEYLNYCIENDYVLKLRNENE